MAKKNSSSSADNFHTYYRELYPERWENLVRGIRLEKVYFGLEPLVNSTATYFLDRASVVAALALQVCPGHQVLDMCAAPGGKSLVILRKLFPEFYNEPEKLKLREIEEELNVVFQNPDRVFADEFGNLTANEKSAPRRRRLYLNIHAHLSGESQEKAVKFTSYDAANFGRYQPNSYDRVLADVPCSSEAHVLEDSKYLDQWSPSRTKHLSIQAGSIGLSGFDALKPGGLMVYSTCSLSPLENQGVVNKILKKRPGAQEVRLSGVPSWIEDLGPGYGIFPDLSQGLGPIYFAILTKQIPR